MFINAEAIEIYDVECQRIPKRSSAWKGAVAGAAGGLVASWIMNQFQAATSKAAELMKTEDTNSHAEATGGEDATIKAASAISESVADHRLTADEKKVAGPAVHYVFGSAMGALYGVASEFVPTSSLARGVPFGAALWFGADEVAVPMLGLSRSPTATSVSTHASALAAHLVYGFTTDAVRRAIRTSLA